jgi:hypothetical protein
MAEKYHILPHLIMQLTPAEFYLNLLLATIPDQHRTRRLSPPPQERTATLPSLAQQLAQYEVGTNGGTWD